MTTGYDEALFRQLLLKASPDRVTTIEEIVAAFRVVAWDIYEAVRQQRPDLTAADVDAAVRKEYAPGLAAVLRAEGWKVL